MSRVTVSVLLLSLLLFSGPAFAQNPCEEEGAGCRVMTAAELSALKARFLALKAALPAPDPARYVPDGAGDNSEMPFVAQVNIAGRSVCLSWPAGCFVTDDNVDFGYVPKAEPGQAKQPSGLLGRAQALMGSLENRLEVTAWMRPHAHLVSNENGRCVDVMEESAVNVEKTASLLAYDYGEDASNTTLIFGPRTCNEAEAERVDAIAKAFAPVASIEVIISGPPEEVAALKKKIDRKAIAALLGPVVR